MTTYEYIVKERQKNQVSDVESAAEPSPETKVIKLHDVCRLGLLWNIYSIRMNISLQLMS